MPQDRAAATRGRLIKAGTELIRRKGFIATRVEDVCERSGITKGAFFHHFKTKEELAEACLVHWRETTALMVKNAPFQQGTDPSQRVLDCFDFFAGIFEHPNTLKSCLAGTTVQEISDTHPQLREAAHQCFLSAKGHFKAMLDEAYPGDEGRPDTASLADLWMAAVQGSLILYKASGDPAVIRTSLDHVKRYIAGCLPQTTQQLTKEND